MDTAKPGWTFISYSRKDKDFALQFTRELKSAGHLVWLDQLDIPTGARWDDAVERALRECEIFLIILTAASISSENVKDEIGYAIDHGKRIMPVLLEECDIPLRLRRFQYVDFTKMNFDQGVKRAKQLLENVLTDQPVPDPTKMLREAQETPRIKVTSVSSLPPQKKSLPYRWILVGAGVLAFAALLGALSVIQIFRDSLFPPTLTLVATNQSNSPIVQAPLATSTSDPAGCRLSQDTFSETDHWGNDTVEWGEWGHVNGAYNMKLQYPGGILKRAWSETESPENFRISVITSVTTPGGTWGIYYFDTGQNWSAFEIDSNGKATIKKYENSQGSILGESEVPLLEQNRLKFENIGGEFFAYVNEDLVMQGPAEPPIASTYGIGLTITSGASAPVEVTFDDFSFSTCP